MKPSQPSGDNYRQTLLTALIAAHLERRLGSGLTLMSLPNSSPESVGDQPAFCQGNGHNESNTATIEQHVDVGYFLSGCGQRIQSRAPTPPAQLEARAWKRAYTMFYRELNGGSTSTIFAKSLKIVREMFDYHLQSIRSSWRPEGDSREPGLLPVAAGRVLRFRAERSEAELSVDVTRFTDNQVAQAAVKALSDLYAETNTSGQNMLVRTEGGRRAVVANRIERDQSLRDTTLRPHGLSCQGYRFSLRTAMAHGVEAPPSFVPSECSRERERKYAKPTPGWTRPSSAQTAAAWCIIVATQC